MLTFDNTIRPYTAGGDGRGRSTAPPGTGPSSSAWRPSRRAPWGTHVNRHFDPARHILGGVVRITSSRVLTDEELTRAVRHEMGHGLGLGHTGACPADLGLMRPTPFQPLRLRPRQGALVGMYARHAHP